MPDRVFAHILAHELIAVLDHVDELVVGDEREPLRGHQNHDNRENETDDHPKGVLSKSECTRSDDVRRIERMHEVIGPF